MKSASPNEVHENWMHMAFEEALQAIGKSNPNPAVGAVLVRDGILVGKGHTQPPGSHHAEIMALQDAGEKARGADLYVTLEPCCHWGRTPPCTDAILAAGVARTFVSFRDPNPKVAGGGFCKLREGGVDVQELILPAEGVEFYRGYEHHMRTGLPWVDIKIAQTLDGFIAGPKGERTQISCPEASQWVHRLRARVDIIAVGGGTVRHDDPLLTVRGVPGHSPRRLIVSRSGDLPAHAKTLSDLSATTLLFSANDSSFSWSNIPRIPWGHETFAESWQDLLQKLGSEGTHRILVEAGATLAGLFLPNSTLWNRFLLLTSPIFLGEGVSWSSSIGKDWKDGLRLSRFGNLGHDFLAEFEHVYRDHTSGR